MIDPINVTTFYFNHIPTDRNSYLAHNIYPLLLPWSQNSDIELEILPPRENATFLFLFAARFDHMTELWPVK